MATVVKRNDELFSEFMQRVSRDMAEQIMSDQVEELTDLEIGLVGQIYDADPAMFSDIRTKAVPFMIAALVRGSPPDSYVAGMIMRAMHYALEHFEVKDD